MKLRENQTIFIRFLFSYLLLLVLPLGAVFWFFYYNLVEEMNAFQLSKANDELQKISYSIDLNIRRISLLPLSITQNNFYNNFDGLYSQNYTTFLRQKAFNSLLVAENILENCLYYERGSSEVYSRDTVYNIATINQYLPLSIPEYGTISQLLTTCENSQTISMVHAPNRSLPYCLFVAPLPFGSRQAKGSIVMLLDTKVFTRLTGSPLSDSTSFFIYDEVNTLVYSSNGQFLTLEQLHQQSDLQELSLFTSTSGTTGWSYAMVMDNDALYGKINSIKDSFLLLMLGVMILGGGFIFLSIRINYNPINALYHTLTCMGENSSAREQASTMQDFARQALSIKNFSNRNKQAIADYLLGNILLSAYDDVAEFNGLGRDMGMAFYESHYVVLVICTTHHIAETDRLIEGIELEALGYGSGYVRRGDSKNMFILIVGLRDRSQGAIDSLSATIYQLVQTFDADPIVSVGNPCSRFFDIPLSYHQACTALNYSGKQCITHFASIQQKDFEGQAALLTRFEIYWQNRDSKQILLQLKLLEQESTKFSIIFLKQWCSTLLSTTVDNYPQLLAQIDSLNNSQDVFALLHSYMDNLNDQTKLLEAGDPLINRIHSFVEQNIYSFDLSVQFIANGVHKNATYLCRYYKQHTGVTLLDHINRIKLSKAQYLLLSSGMTVSEIAQKLNYCTDSSFIRMFKGQCGVTPGQYRLQNTQLSDENR